ncbi:MAG: phosphate ABC transporter permease PstA [Fimbriimonadaceae bacterium]|nr:phosphate ABC transporter permease PstA [Fimbriimonadaceae bacterium]
MRQLTADQSAAVLRRRRRADKLFGSLCLLAAAFAVAVLVVIIGKLLVDGAARLRPDFLTTFPAPRPEKAGILSPIVGSLWVMGLTLLFTVPVGIAAAVYLEEFTSRKTRLTEFIQINIANLAGVPSIVFGMLGLGVFVAVMGLDFNILAGSLTMSILVLPMVIIVSQEAIKAVPRSYREASLALGCTKWQTIVRVVLPNAMGGILTGIILAASRAIGETAPLIVVGAVGYVTFLPQDVTSRYTVLPLQIFDWITRPAPGFKPLVAAAIIVLVASLVLLNSVAIIIRARSQPKA